MTISQFIPYLTSSVDACQRESDCSLQSGHPGDCYPIGLLYEPTRSHIAARRFPPGAPASGASDGGAERLGKITSNVSVPTHAEGTDRE